MAKYNSGFKYNSGLIYNDRIAYMAVGNGGISLSGSMVRKASFFRRFFSSLSSIGYISRKTYGTVGNGWTAIATSIRKRTSKTVSNGKTGASGTIVKKIAKQFYSSLASSSFLSAKTIFRRLLTGEVSISQTLSKRISKAISSIVDIQSSFNRVSTYFRDVGYQFYYNMGLRYNIPIEQNGNVNISGGISKSMQYVRALYSNITTTSILSRTGFFNRTSGNANMPIASNIRKSISKSITATLGMDATLGRAATFFRDTVSNIAISGEIVRKASFFRRFFSSVSSIGYISRKTYGTVGNGRTAIATSIGKKTSKTISSSMKAISGTVNRVSTYFRYYSGNVSISGGISKSAMFARKIFCSVNVSAMLNRVGFFNRLFSNNNVTISSSMGKRTSKTVSNGKTGASGTIVKKIAKQFYSSLASSSFLSAKTIFRRLLTGEVSISQTLSKRISKAIASAVDIQTSFGRIATYFRDVGYQFYYNMGLRYNTPIEQNGNVNISGNISKSMQYVRALYSSLTTAGILSRVGFFNRSSGNANMSISSNIRKSISKSMTAILSIDATLSRAATFFRDTVSNIAITGEILRNAFYARSLSAYMDISGTVTKARNVIISAYMDIASGIGKSIDKYLTDNVYLYSSLSRQASFYRSFSGLIDSSSALGKTSQFIRNIGNGAISMSSKISKAISKSIFSTVMISRDAMQFVGSGIVRITSTLTRLKYHFLVTLDGILLPLGVRVLRDSSVDIVPSVKDYTEEIPGRHGEISFKTELGSRAIELHVAEEMTPEERENLKRQYAKHIISEDTKTLVFESDVEKSYEVKYAGKIDPTQYPLHMDFAIPFKMAKPFINGSYEKELKGSGVIANDGTVETPLIIEIKGQISNPTVVIGDDVLAYNGSLSNDETLVIDTEKQTAKIGSVNVLDKFSGDFKTLEPGKVNVVADDNVTIRWRDRWI